jgi:hypothetical protein
MTVFRSRAIADRAKVVAVNELKPTVEGGEHGMRMGRLSTYAARRDRVAEYNKMSRDDFDALPEERRAQILAELRAIRESGDTSTSRDRTYGGVFRGDANHVSTAKFLADKFTRERYVAPDNSVEGRVARLREAGDDRAARDVLSGATISQMREVSQEFGFGWSTGWKSDRLRDHIVSNLAEERAQQRAAADPAPPTVTRIDEAHHMIRGLTTTGGLEDRGALRASYREALSQLEGLMRQGPARRGAREQYYRPMMQRLERALDTLERYNGTPAERAKLRGLIAFYRSAI